MGEARRRKQLGLTEPKKKKETVLQRKRTVTKSIIDELADVDPAAMMMAMKALMQLRGRQRMLKSRHYDGMDVGEIAGKTTASLQLGGANNYDSSSDAQNQLLSDGRNKNE